MIFNRNGTTTEQRHTYRSVAIIAICLLAITLTLAGGVTAQDAPIGNNTTTDNATGNGTVGNGTVGNGTGNGSGVNVGVGVGVNESDGPQGEKPYGNDTIGNWTDNVSVENGSGNNSTVTGINAPKRERKGIFGAVFNAFVDAIMFVLLKLGLEQGIKATDQLSDIIIQVSAYTPYPHDAGGWYRNPPGDLFGMLWQEMDEKGIPLAKQILLVNIFGTYAMWQWQLIDGFKLKQIAKKNAAAWIYVYNAKELTGFFLHFVAGVTQWFTADIQQTSVANLGFKALVLVLIIGVIVFHFWLLLATLLAIGLRIGALAFLAPYLPVIIALSGTPILGISMAMNMLAKAWAWLALMAIPMSAALSFGFSAHTAGIVAATPVDAVAQGMVMMAVKIGSLAAALLMPYIMMQGGGSMMGMMSGGVVGGVSAKEMQAKAGDVKESASQSAQNARQRVTAGRDMTRGVRGKQPLGDDPSSSYKTGAAAASTVGTYANRDAVSGRLGRIRGDRQTTAQTEEQRKNDILGDYE